MSTKKLKTALFMSEMAEKSAGSNFLMAQQRLSDQEAKLWQMEKYKHDYTVLAGVYSGVTTDASSLKIARRFLKQLDEVVSRQTSTVSAHVEDLERYRQTWLHSRSYNKAIGTLISKRAAEEELERVKKHQRVLDDFFASHDK